MNDLVSFLVGLVLGGVLVIGVITIALQGYVDGMFDKYKF